MSQGLLQEGVFVGISELSPQRSLQHEVQDQELAVSGTENVELRSGSDVAARGRMKVDSTTSTSSIGLDVGTEAHQSEPEDLPNINSKPGQLHVYPEWADFHERKLQSIQASSEAFFKSECFSSSAVHLPHRYDNEKSERNTRTTEPTSTSPGYASYNSKKMNGTADRGTIKVETPSSLRKSTSENELCRTVRSGAFRTRSNPTGPDHNPVSNSLGFAPKHMKSQHQDGTKTKRSAALSLEEEVRTIRLRNPNSPGQRTRSQLSKSQSPNNRRRYNIFQSETEEKPHPPQAKLVENSFGHHDEVSFELRHQPSQGSVESRKAAKNEVHRSNGRSQHQEVASSFVAQSSATMDTDPFKPSGLFSGTLSHPVFGEPYDRSGTLKPNSFQTLGRDITPSKSSSMDAVEDILKGTEAVDFSPSNTTMGEERKPTPSENLEPSYSKSNFNGDLLKFFEECSSAHGNEMRSLLSVLQETHRAARENQKQLQEVMQILQEKNDLIEVLREENRILRSASTMSDINLM